MKDNWISVKVAKPHCPRNPNALGTPVLIWPRDPIGDSTGIGYACFGRRATGRPAFYLYGAEIHGVTHWQPLPEGPKVNQ
jgi:hypothetical protein